MAHEQVEYEVVTLGKRRADGRRPSDGFGVEGRRAAIAAAKSSCSTRHNPWVTEVEVRGPNGIVFQKKCKRAKR